MARIRRHQLDSLKIHHVGMEVADMTVSLILFRDVLGFSLEDQFQIEEEWVSFLQMGGLILELVQPLNRTLTQPEFHLALCIENLEDVLMLFPDLEWEQPAAYPNGWTSAFMKVDHQFYIEWLKVN